MKKPKMTEQALSRRRFLKGAAGVSAFMILPSYAVASSPETRPGGPRVAPSDKINLAIVGIGNQGGGIGRAMGGSPMSNVVALCDVDTSHAVGRGDTIRQFPDAPLFQDFREMFDKMADQIDAVIIGTPDHTHFPIAMLAMSLGKHVFVEKPLAHTFQECELMMQAEKKYKVATQMGNQGHSGNNFLQFKAWTEAGVIKDVTHVDAFMNSPRRWHGWQIEDYPQAEPIPETLDWDLWHTTRAMRPFNGRYHPANWRSWFDFGNGAFGDWGPHILDTIHRFLELGLPSNVAAVHREGPNPFIFPQASTIKFSFPERGEMPPMTITWYDGVNNKPELPPEMEGMNLRANGKLIYSKEHVFYGGTHHDTLRIVPDEKMRELAPQLPRITERQSSHYDNFLKACRGEEECRSSFAVSGLLSQVFSLGVIAQRIGGDLDFDRAAKRFRNNDEANKWLVGPEPRPGWEQYYTL